MIFANTQRHDPYRNFNFKVLFSGRAGIRTAGFNKVSGIKVRHDYLEYKEGGNNGSAEQIPTDTVYEPIVMRKGISDDMDIVKHLSNSVSKDGSGLSKSAKMDIIIQVLDRDSKRPAKTYKLINAWISAYETGELDAMGAEVFFEQITISFTNVDFLK